MEGILRSDLRIQKFVSTFVHCVTSRSKEEEEGNELITNFSGEVECVLALISWDRIGHWGH